jgi:hypothetical protein
MLAGVTNLLPPDVPLPDALLASRVVAAPGEGVGHWSGAPSAVLDGDVFWLAYRVRRPVAEGRGVAVVLARYDGRTVEPVAEVAREGFGAESLERPALVRRPDGGWRLYVSCATPGSKHWWVECLDADTVAGLPDGIRTMVFPGDEKVAVKDPVIRWDQDGWHAWVCCHPLDEPGQEDRMWTDYARSDDGLVWSEPVPALRPSGDGWDARGTRVTAVLPAPGERGWVAYYDGRHDAAENWYERTGLALVGEAGPGEPLATGELVAEQLLPIGSPYGTHALRYLCVVPVPSGGYQLFYEASRQDGAHDLVTQRVPAA